MSEELKNEAPVEWSEGQSLRLARAVQDDETGYTFPAGSAAKFEERLGSDFCLISIDSILGDSLDSGTAFVMVQFEDIEPF